MNSNINFGEISLFLTVKNFSPNFIDYFRGDTTNFLNIMN